MHLQKWFEAGVTYDNYFSHMEVNQKEVKHVYDSIAFSDDDLLTFQKIKDQQLRGIVLTADWCGDAALNVPIIQRIAEKCSIDLHYLLRDENLELMDQYLTNGTSRAIPIFIFIDQAGKERFVWGPRAVEVQSYVADLRNALPATDSPDFAVAQKKMFEDFKKRVTSDNTIWRYVIDSVKMTLTESK